MDRFGGIDDTPAPRTEKPGVAIAACFEWSRTSRFRRHAATDRDSKLCKDVTNRMQSTARMASAVSSTPPVRRCCEHPEMNTPLIVAAAILALSLSSCVIPLPIVGGGIAGAGMDPLWVRKGAENYRGFTSPSVTVAHLQNRKTTVRNDRSDFFSRFATRTHVRDDTPTDFAGMTITCHKQQITMTRHNQVIVSERIPSAFYYSGLQVVSVRIHGVPCLLLATHSRASTHMVWIGFYRADGTRLYLATVSRGSILDVVPSPDGFTLVGGAASTRISLISQ